MKITLLIFLLFLYFTFLPAQQSSAVTSDQQASEPEASKAIPVSEITSRADDINTQLSKIIDESQQKPEIKTIEEQLPGILDTLNASREKAIYKQLEDLSLRVLQNNKQEWNIYLKQLEDWKQVLVTRSHKFEEQISALKAMAEIWQATSDLAAKEKAPTAIRKRVSSVLSEIRKTETGIAKRLNTILIIQNLISQNQIEINKLIEKIQKAENEVQGQLFVIDNPPLWEIVLIDKDSLALSNGFGESWSELLRSNIAFVNANEDKFYLHLGIYILLICLMIYLNLKNKRDNLFNEKDKLLKASAYFISRPFSAATLITLMLSIRIYPEITTTVTDFMVLLLLFPVIRLIPGIFPSQIRPIVYFTAIIFFIDLMQRNAIGFVQFQRVILMLVTVCAIIFLIWFLYFRRKTVKSEIKSWSKLFDIYIPIGLVLLIVALAGNLIGAVSLASRITWGIVESTYVLVTVYISAVVLTGLVAVLIRRRRRRAAQFITTFAGQIERWAKTVIFIIALFIWFRATLKSFGLYDLTNKWFAESLEHVWTIGTIQISVNAIFDFCMILIATFVFIPLIRAFMELEIFPRLSLPKGLPAAITMMVRYLLTAVGIFLALSALGMELGKIGILAGALGVGLGFGLQKIVANFISSLIIAFNRLIRVGDTVAYEDVMGNVTDVGANASTVRTFEGSEVIIPNADLISNRVTNWTLTDNRRRMQLPVKVAYGSDPHKVINLLEKVARYHPDVLPDPEPFAIFNGFLEHSLDFTLYFWILTADFFKTKNDIGLGVHDILAINGIDTPRPWRNLKVSVDDSPPETQMPVKKTGQRKRTTGKRNSR